MIGKRMLLLINESSGRGQMSSSIYDIVERMTVAGYEVTLFPINPELGLGAENVLPVPTSVFDRIVCCGGDGTLNHVINRMMRSEDRQILGYIPTGSTNDFAYGMRLSGNVEEACGVITGGEEYAYDIGSFNERYYNYIAAFGAFVPVSYATKQKLKNTLGHAAYVLTGITQLAENMKFSCHMRIESDAGTEEGDYIFGAVSNTMSVGGITIKGTSRHQLSDGKFELFLIKKPENIMQVSEILNCLLVQSVDSPYITSKRVDWVHFEAEKDTEWTLDGEDGGAHGDVTIKVCRKAMKIMIPRD